MRLTIPKGERRNRLAFWSGRTTALQATDDVVTQLREQLEQARQQLKFEREEHERERKLLIRDLLQAKYEISKRDVAISFAAAPSPSASKH